MSVHPVPTANIQGELSKIWDTLEGTGKMRACLFNLIFFVQKNHREGYFRTVAQKVIEKFPSRVIFVTVDKTQGQNYLNAGVSVMTSSHGQHEVVCDLIQLDVAGPMQVRIPFVILPHILPDLPVYLIWAEDPIREDPFSYHLEPFASRMIFDSESTDNLPHFAQTVLEYRRKSQADVADLNWARLESWRDLLSLTFYSPQRLKELQTAKEIKITFNAQETPFFCHTKIQSIYLQGWLASQLGWQCEGIFPEENEGVRLAYRRKEGFVHVLLTPARHTHIAPGTVISFELRSEQGRSFSFARSLEFPQQITMHICSDEKCELPSTYLFAKGESGQSLVKEICHKGTSSHYLKVLELVKNMEPLALCQ